LGIRIRGTTTAPACWILCGYASGFASHCLGRPIYFVESVCRARGAAVCSVTGRDEASWGKRAAAIADGFRAEDIDGKISRLTAELARRERELAEERRRVMALDLAGPTGLAPTRSTAFGHVLDLAARVARFVHAGSARSAGPFVAINCSALPETLLESELFGHKAGAFTGAVRDRAGLFEEAEGGTLFLDEVGDVSAAVQAKLLRVLQERMVRRVGENRLTPVNARVLAATNHDLEAAVAAGRFREDLLYRIRVMEIRLPPLRERREDILPLARHFGERLKERLGLPRFVLDSTCLDALTAYDWPGNVRELENALERAAVLLEDGRIRPEHLPPPVVRRRNRPGAESGNQTLESVEREHVESLLECCEGNRTRAARVLGVSPSTLWRKMRAWDRAAVRVPQDSGGRR
jgi:two-component system, NtrC family, response regulator HydG